MPHDLAGLVLHRHHPLGVTQGYARGDFGVPGQKRRKHQLIPMQQETHAGQGAGGIDKTGNHGCRPTVPAHGIDRNDDGSVV